MALTFFLTERTPYRLRYIIVAGGSTFATDTGILVNRNGPSPDLRGDASVEMGSAIWNLVATPGITTQAMARRIMFGDALTAAPGAPQTDPLPYLTQQLDVPRAHCYLTLRDRHAADPQWAVDATFGAAVDVASTGFAVLVVTGSPTAMTGCFLDIDFQHTFDR